MTRTHRRRWGPLLVVAGCAVLLVASLVMLARQPVRPIQSVLGEGSLASVVPEPVQTPARQAATMSWRAKTAVPLRLAVGATGVVTEAGLQAGTALRSGDRVISVDGAGVVALATSIPLYRPIGVTTVGADVESLGSALSNLGLMGGGDVGRTARWGLLAAIARFQKKYRDGGGGGTALVFDPSWVVWIPSSPMVVQTVTVAVGEPPPATVGTVSSAAPTVSLVDAQGHPVASDTWDRLTLVSIDGTPPSTDHATVADLARDPSTVVSATSSTGGVSSPGQNLSERPSGSGSGSGSGTAGAGAIQARTMSWSLVIEGQETVTGVVLPLTALLGTPSHACVAPAGPGAQGHRVLAVEVKGTSGARPVVTGLAAGQAVLAAPNPLMYPCT